MKHFTLKSAKRVSSIKKLASLGIILSGLMAAPAMADVELVFGTYAADKPTTTVRKYKPFLDSLAFGMAKVLGEPVKIRMKIAKNYETGISNLADGQVDFARFGPASYVTVYAQNSGIEIVAMESKKGKKRFKGIIAVHKTSELKSLSELSQKSFAFGDKLSTIGRYLSQSHLVDAGITSESLSNFSYLGRHDLVGTAVGTGRFTAGALKESTFKKLVAKDVPIRKLFEFDNVTKPWLAASGMEPRILNAMRQVMLHEKNKSVLEKVSKDGFVQGSDADYDFIRKAMEHSKKFDDDYL
jgi:phosphonate transport system substrate-binding protein